jgi:hypothetical protein
MGFKLSCCFGTIALQKLALTGGTKNCVAV